MESILIWFATGFSFAFGTACGFFCFTRRPSKHDTHLSGLMKERNTIDRDKVEVLERIAVALEGRQTSGENK